MTEVPHRFGALYPAFFQEMARLAVLWVVAVLLALLPVLERGSEYLPDGDELLYRAWSRDVVQKGSTSLVDATHRKSGPMMHPQLLFVPPGLLCRGLGLRLIHIGTIWRVLCGIGIVTCLYWLAVRATSSRPLAALLALFLLCDSGLMLGQVGFRGPTIGSSLLSHSDTFFNSVPVVMPHLRVVTPGLAIPFLLIHFGLVQSAYLKPSRSSITQAAASFGVLFYTYFYFWTAAVLTLVTTTVLYRKTWKTTAAILIGGLIIGLPALVSATITKAATPPDWLLRTEKFVTVARLSDLILPYKVIFIWLSTTYWVFRRRQDLIHLWCFVGVSFVAMNSQLITARQFENFHWVAGVGLGLSILLLMLLGNSLESSYKRKTLRVLILLVVAGQVVLGFRLRQHEGSITKETRFLAELQEKLRSDSPPIPTGSTIAGDNEVTLLLAGRDEFYPLSGRLVEYSAKATDQELDERLILNLFLKGVPRDEATSLVDGPPGVLSREAGAIHNPSKAKQQRDRRRQILKSIYEDPREALEKYKVDFALIKSKTPRENLEPYGRLIFQGTHWDLWQLD